MPHASPSPPSRRRLDSEPVGQDVIAAMRRRLNGDTSRASLRRFGLAYSTALAALAGMPISAGSRALLREALAKEDS